MNPLHPEQDQNQENVQSWATASAQAIRFEQVKQAERAKALSHGATEYMTESNAEDCGQIAAWLDRLACNGQLRVIRTTADEGRIASHIVEILHENEDGEVVSTECGGYVPMWELRRGYCGGTDWLYAKEEVSHGWVRIAVMITDNFPDHPMFKRADGSDVELGFNDNDHFHLFEVVIHEADLVDEF
jgi:hypothetical protein